MKTILESAGFQTISASNGREAWDLVQHQDFDLVVSDVDMPVMTGFEFTQQVRENMPDSDLPIILVTARGSDADKQRGLRVGANAYVEKGAFDQQRVLGLIGQLI